MFEKKAIAKDEISDYNLEALKKYFTIKKCNFIGMGMFDTFNLSNLLSNPKFHYYPRDERKFFVRRFPILLSYNICFETFKEILDLYWSDNIMERRIIAFYDKETIYTEPAIIDQKEIDFVYDFEDFDFSIENCPDNYNNEYMLVFNPQKFGPKFGL